MKLPALSIRQPWAWAIAHGYKPVENRTWRTNFRGRFLIHTGQKFDMDGLRWIAANNIGLGIAKNFTGRQDVFRTGGIIGIATITDCVDDMDSPWFFGPHGFVIQDAEPLPFTAMPGRLGFFEASIPDFAGVA